MVRAFNGGVVCGNIGRQRPHLRTEHGCGLALHIRGRGRQGVD